MTETWVGSNHKWKLVTDTGRTLATVEKETIPPCVEINIQYVVSLVGGDVENCKRRAERVIEAIRQSMMQTEDDRKT